MLPEIDHIVIEYDDDECEWEVITVYNMPNGGRRALTNCLQLPRDTSLVRLLHMANLDAIANMNSRHEALGLVDPTEDRAEGIPEPVQDETPTAVLKDDEAT